MLGFLGVQSYLLTQEVSWKPRAWRWSFGAAIWSDKNLRETSWNGRIGVVAVLQKLGNKPQKAGFLFLNRWDTTKSWFQRNNRIPQIKIFIFSRIGFITLPETNGSPLKIGRAPKGNCIFQQSIFRGKLANCSFTGGFNTKWRNHHQDFLWLQFDPYLTNSGFSRYNPEGMKVFGPCGSARK